MDVSWDHAKLAAQAREARARAVGRSQPRAAVGVAGEAGTGAGERLDSPRKGGVGLPWIGGRSWGDWREHTSSNSRTSVESPSGITMLEGLFLWSRRKKHIALHEAS